MRFVVGMRVVLRKEFETAYPSLVGKTFEVVGESQNQPTLADNIYLREVGNGKRYRLSSKYFEEVE